MPQRALVIFDVDGTLLRTDRVTVPAVRETFARFGLPEPGEEDIVYFFGRAVSEYEAWLAEQCTPGQAAQIVAETNALELEMISGEGKLYPGVREALDALKGAGHVLAICSNGPEAYVQEFLGAHGLRDFFSLVYARGSRYDGKETMVRLIRESYPDLPAVVIGDRHDDIEAAHANGARAIAATYGFGSGSELCDADTYAHAPDEIPAAIQKTMVP